MWYGDAKLMAATGNLSLFIANNENCITEANSQSEQTPFVKGNFVDEQLNLCAKKLQESNKDLYKQFS